MQHFQELKTQLFSQIVVVGREDSHLDAVAHGGNPQDTEPNGSKSLRDAGALAPSTSLLPFSDTSIDETIKQLEEVSPILQPLSFNYLSSLMGDWQLVYASNGTVITRPLAEMIDIFGSGIKVQRIWQSLNNIDGEIRANNQAIIELPLIGEYQLGAEGVWIPEADERTAKVTFNAFAAQATKLFGQSDWSLPELKIPVLDFLKNEAVWITSYLDEDTRIGRGGTGNLFVFRR